MKEKIKMSTNKMFGSTQTNGFIRVKQMLQEYPWTEGLYFQVYI